MILTEFHPNLRIRLAVGFVHRLLSFMIAPLMTIHLANRLGVVAAGTMLLVAVAAAVAGMFAGGHLSDSRGRRPVLLTSESGILLGFAVMALAASPWWGSAAATFAGFLLYSAAGGLGFPANDAMIIDVTTPETRVTIYTVNYWSLNLGFACGALIGGFAYAEHFADLLVAGALLSLGVIAVTWTFLVETRPEPGGAPTGRERSGVRAVAAGYAGVLRDRMFARVVLAAVALGTVEWQLTYYIGIRLAEGFQRQALLTVGPWRPEVDGVELLGLLRALNTVLVVCLALQVRRLLRPLPERVRLYGGIALFTAGFMVLAVSGTGWVLIAAAVVYTVGELMNVPIRQTLVADLVDPGARTRYMAVYGLHPRMAAMTASLCVVAGSLLPPALMAGLYAVLGLAAALLLRPALRVRAARRGPAASPPADPSAAAHPTAAAAWPGCPRHASRVRVS